MAIEMNQFLVIMIVAAIVAVVAKYIRWPYTIVLLISGLFVAFFGMDPPFELDKDMIFHILLPPLLFEGALHMRLRHLKENAKIISMLAVPGLILSAFFVGFLVWIVTNNILSLVLTFPVALLIAIIIIPTDPVSILAVYKETKVPSRLKNIIEGESIFDDGIVLVMFAVLIELIFLNNLDIAMGIFDFLRMSILGIILGIAAGYLAYWILSRIDDKFTEIMITIIIVFGLFAMAEYFEASGIFAVVMVGLILGNYGTRFAMAPSTRHSLLNFWGFIVFLVNSFLFIMVGMKLDLSHVWDEIVLVLFCVLCLWMARGFTIFAIGKVVNRNKAEPELPKKWQAVMWWGGLRGAIPMALALSIPEFLSDGLTPFPFREEILAITFGVVFITLLAQGLTLRTLLQRLGFHTPSKQEMEQEEREIQALIRDITDELAEMRDEGEISNQAFEWLNHKFAQANSQLLTELGMLVQEHGIIPREEYMLAVKETLEAKQNIVKEAWERELIPGAIGEKLIFEMEQQIQTMSSDVTAPRMPSDIFRSVTPGHRVIHIERNCGICLASIQQGEPSLKCRCGTIFHNSCLEDLDRCPICIAVLDKGEKGENQGFVDV